MAHALVQLPSHPESRRGRRPCVTVLSTHLTIDSAATNFSRPLGAGKSRTDGQRSLSLTLTASIPLSSHDRHNSLCRTAFTSLPPPSLSSSVLNFNRKEKKKSQFLQWQPAPPLGRLLRDCRHFGLQQRCLERKEGAGLAHFPECVFTVIKRPKWEKKTK